MPRKKQQVPTEVQEMTRAELALELKTAKVYNDIPIDQPIPADYNPREEVEPGTRLWNELEASLREFGFADPIVVNSDWTIIGGHQRLKVAKALGFKTCIVSMVDVDKTREKAMNIALNKITGNWKEMMLADLLKQLRGNIDPAAIGFNEAEMEAAMNKASAEVKDDNFDIDSELKRPVFTKLGDIWHLGRHKIICGDSTSEDTFTKLMDGQKANLVMTDPPYNVDVEETAGKILNDNMGDSEFHEFLLSAYKCMYANLADDGSIYVWHADTEGINFRTAFKEAGFYLSGCCIWVKNSLVLGRSPYQWRHEPCGIEGSLVLTPNGELPIESLKDGDKVVAWNPKSQMVTGYRDGVAVKTAHRHYCGTVYGISAGGKQTWVTDNHRFTARMNKNASEKYCTYLMVNEKGWWRVGRTRFFTSRGFGIKDRMHQEEGIAAWLIEVFDTEAEAQLGEQFIATTYGIPFTFWKVTNRQYPEGRTWRNEQNIEDFYARYDLESMNERANQLLSDFGRRFDYPLTTMDNIGNTSAKTQLINACNLIPGLMSVPVPYKKWEGQKTFDWEEIDAVDMKEYDGEVYSLEVPQFEHYVQDGIITHNCLFGWKAKGKHQWYGDRKQTTVLEFDKPKSSPDHPTTKPVPLLVSQIKNSTMTNGIVLDSFLGSGSTLIACCETDRICRGVELDPKFVDVEVKRYIEWNGGDYSDVWCDRNGQHLKFDEVCLDGGVKIVDEEQEA